MGNLPSKTGLLLSAFAPLFFAVALVLRNWWGLACVVLGFVGCLWLYFVIREVKKLAPEGFQAKQVRYADEQVLRFTASFVVPVLIPLIGKATPGAAAGTGLVIVVLFIVYWRGNLFHLNPTLTIFGYHLYEITTEQNLLYMALSKRSHLKQDESVQYRRISGNTIFI